MRNMIIRIGKGLLRRKDSYLRNFKLALFRIRFPRVEIISNPARRLKELKKIGFHSQHGQDEYVLQRFFQNRTGPGFFVDIGANDPVFLNNTYYFEKELGWTGLCVEPLPHFKDAWQTSRSAQFVQCAATDSPGKLEFDVVEQEHWGHAFSAIAGESDKYKNMQRERIQVNGRRLADVFSENKITHIDFMSLDVEGHELSALNSINFTHTTIDVIAVENNAPSFEFGSAEIRRFLNSNGYIFLARFPLLDDIFAREEFLQGMANL